MPAYYAAHPTFLAQDLDDADPLSEVLPDHPDRSVFPASSVEPPDRLELWANEFAPEWLYFLDKHQDVVCSKLVSMAEQALLSDVVEHPVMFLVGGPGTGKTSILIQLLMLLSSEVVPSAETWRVGLRVSDSVAALITASTGWDLTSTRELGHKRAQPDVLLVDDPEDVEEIRSLGAAALRGAPRALICAFDPLQLSSSVSDDLYQDLLRELEAEEFSLTSCYRQKRAVGRAATDFMDIVASSSPYLDGRKMRTYRDERATLTSLANTLTFPNPSGHAKTFLDAEYRHWSQHVRWVNR